MENKTKFDKKKCMKCKYHGVGCGGETVRRRNEMVHVYCNYSSITNSTCLKRGPHGTVTDLRGDDYNNCKLYDPGKAKRERYYTLG